MNSGLSALCFSGHRKTRKITASLYMVHLSNPSRGFVLQKLNLNVTKCQSEVLVAITRDVKKKSDGHISSREYLAGCA